VVSGSTTVDNGDDAIGDVAAGHTVRVVATSSNSTATTIVDANIATQPGGAQPGAPGPVTGT